MSLISFEQSLIYKMSIHFVGNRTKGEELKVTNSSYDLNDEVLYEALKQYFLSPFKGEEMFTFQDSESTVQTIVNQIFEKKHVLHAKSKELAQYLYQCGDNKKIKSGQLYVVYLKDCIYDDEVVDAIGIFKAENTQTFLKCREKNEEANIHADQGFNIQALDKGCVIFNINSEDGYRCAVIDNKPSIATAMYWKTDFLGMIPVDEEYFLTNKYMEMVKGFTKDVISVENDMPREEALDFLYKSGEYFLNNEEFDTKAFVKLTLGNDPELAESFLSYKESYESDKYLPNNEKFTISAKSVEKFAPKHFKSVIKLDRNFQIQINGDMNSGSGNIERGYDETKKMHYYKLYYNNEG